MGAYDLIRRQVMLKKLARRPKLRTLLPFARMSYGQPSRYYWRDDAGERHVIKQGEGGEHERLRDNHPDARGVHVTRGCHELSRSAIRAGCGLIVTS